MKIFISVSRAGFCHAIVVYYPNIPGTGTAPGFFYTICHLLFVVTTRWIYYWLHFVDEELQLREDKPQILITINDKTEICIQDFRRPIHFPFHAPWNDGWNWIKSNRHAFMHPLKHLSTHPCPDPPSTHQSIRSFIPSFLFQIPLGNILKWGNAH